MITFRLVEVWQPFASVTVTLYEPVAATETFGIEGFCRVDVNPLGPIQE